MAKVTVVTDDLLFGSRVEQSLLGAGHLVRVSAEPDPDADVLIADLTLTGDPSALVREGRPVLGYYSHVDPAPRQAAIEAGVEIAVPRSRLVRELPDLLESLLDRDE